MQENLQYQITRAQAFYSHHQGECLIQSEVNVVSETCPKFDLHHQSNLDSIEVNANLENCAQQIVNLKPVSSHRISPMSSLWLRSLPKSIDKSFSESRCEEMVGFSQFGQNSKFESLGFGGQRFVCQFLANFHCFNLILMHHMT